MVSHKQLEANKKNAQSGGVKTINGKSVSRFNAQKHAILRQSITKYEDNFYHGLITDLDKTYRPLGRMEIILVERIAILYVKLHRVQKAETEFIKSILDPHQVYTVGGFKPLQIVGEWEEEKTIIDNEGYTPQISSGDIEHTSQVFGRYETTLENRLYKAMHELERLQRLRKGDKVAAPVMLDIGMGSFGEKEKQDV